MDSLEINLQTDVIKMEPADKFWGNDVIWREITSYLNTTDLKEFSRVNHYFLQRIRSLYRFSSLAGQVVQSDMKIHTFKLSRAIVKLSKIDENVLQDLAPKIFQDTEYLELRNIGRLTNEKMNSRLIQILTNCTNLKSLAFAAKNCLRKNYQDFFKDANVKSILSNLREFAFGGTFNGYVIVETENEDSEDEELSSLHVPSENNTDPFETFKLFADLKLKLEKFSYSDEEYKDSHFYPVLTLSSSQNTLTELTLRIHINGLDRIKAMIFLKLSKLTLELFGSKKQCVHAVGDDVDSEDEDFDSEYTEIFSSTVIPFLRNHLSTLTEFVLDSQGEFSLVPVCEVLKSSTKIKLLNFRGRSSFTRSLPSVNWDFLNVLSTLRFFKISMFALGYPDDEWIITSDEEDEAENLNENERRVRIPKPSRSDSWNRYFQSLPSNVKFISFRGFNFKGRPEDLTSVVTSQLIRFENLTALRMMTTTACPVFFNDEIMQFICKHLTKLRVLKGDFRIVTDFGITGCRDDGYDHSGFSLKNLKGMTKIDLHSKDDGKLLITWNGLLKSIKFLDLFKLTVSATIKDCNYDSLAIDSKDNANYLKLIGQNPSLERISLAFYKPPATLQDKVLKANSRIKLRPVFKRYFF